MWQLLTLSRCGNCFSSFFCISAVSEIRSFRSLKMWIDNDCCYERPICDAKVWLEYNCGWWMVRKETCLWCSNVSWSPSPLLLQEPQCRSSKPGKGKWKWYKSKSESKSYTQVKVIQQWKWKLYKSESYTQVKVIHKWKWYKSESDAKVKHSNWMLKKKED